MRRFDEEEEARQEGRGRSAKKREAKAVEQLAQSLADLSESEIAKLSMEAELAKEVELARNTKGHSSRKRQIKHLAGFLRRHEAERESVAAALEGQSVSQRQETLAFHHLEDLRDRLCSASSFDAAIMEVRTSYPYLDDAKLTRLARSVHENNDKKAAREIFRRLRKAVEEKDL